MAASINIVPEPQKGSTNTYSPFHLEIRTSAAAKVSFNGAIPASSLYPLLCKPAPLVSIDKVTLSFRIATWILYTGPSSLKVSTP